MKPWVCPPSSARESQGHCYHCYYCCHCYCHLNDLISLFRFNLMLILMFIMMLMITEILSWSYKKKPPSNKWEISCLLLSIVSILLWLYLIFLFSFFYSSPNLFVWCHVANHHTTPLFSASHTPPHPTPLHCLLNRKVADPWGGSYMMESLTEKLAEEAMVIIDEVRTALYCTVLCVTVDWIRCLLSHLYYTTWQDLILCCIIWV